MINTHKKNTFIQLFSLSQNLETDVHVVRITRFCSTAFVDVRPAKFQVICLESFSIQIESVFFAIDDDDNEEDGDVVGGCGCWIRWYQK